MSSNDRADLPAAATAGPSWQDRWQAGQIGFHKPEPHDLLVRHQPDLKGRARVYVPLCGKSVDLVWLFEHGHDVVGSEFVPEAVAAFFAEQTEALEAKPTSVVFGDVVLHEVPGLRIVQGDAFAVDTAILGGSVDAVWDRAALVAIDPDRRADYVTALKRVLTRDGVIVLVTFSYDQAKMDGPPWSIDRAEVERLFGADFTIEAGVRRAEAPGPRFVAAGISDVEEGSFVLRRRG